MLVVVVRRKEQEKARMAMVGCMFFLFFFSWEGVVLEDEKRKVSMVVWKGCLLLLVLLRTFCDDVMGFEVSALPLYFDFSVGFVAEEDGLVDPVLWVMSRIEAEADPDEAKWARSEKPVGDHAEGEGEVLDVGLIELVDQPGTHPHRSLLEQSTDFCNAVGGKAFGIATHRRDRFIAVPRRIEFNLVVVGDLGLFEEVAETTFEPPTIETGEFAGTYCDDVFVRRIENLRGEAIHILLTSIHVRKIC